ncbi:hypothetical protein BC835DRAFT_1271812 [Cytidiella melzeri]|nr:hypothetical protein BC835DRAFT_1271812 [Cytidiella melzeri]
MRICANLSRLPKAGPLKSVNFRRTTPGTPYPYISVTGSKGSLTSIDPTHAASSLSHQELRARCPRVHKSAFGLRAVPKATLYVPEPVWPNPPYKPAPPRGEGDRTVNMSFMKTISAKVHKSAVVRKKIATKLKLAVRLIVTRGAQAGKDAEGQSVIVLCEEDAGRKWIIDSAFAATC